MPVLGIDIGTQSLKAVILDDALVMRGAHSAPYQPIYPQPGWAEQDPADWLAALGPAIAGALRRANLAAADVGAIGVAGQLDGCLPTGRDGRALDRCILWMDRRAQEEVDDIPPELVRRRAGLVCDATHMAAKIRWSERRLARARNVAVWHQPVSYVVASLCGRPAMDHALASTTMLYGLAERDYVDDLLAAFEIDRARLPEIADAASVAGPLSAAGAAVTGLPVGIPVTVGTGDDFANVIGAGIAKPGTVVCSLGTAEVTAAVADDLLIDGEALVETHPFFEGTFIIANPGWLAGGAVSWFCDAFGAASAAALSDAAATAPAGSEGLVFLPALSGSMAPRWNSAARGAFYGLTPSHGRAFCARALLEGCAFAMRDVVDRMSAMGLAIERVRLVGGGAASRVWAEIRADLLGRPVEIIESGPAAALGAALLASVAGGICGSVVEAVQALPIKTETIGPNAANAPVYDRAHRRYRRLFEALTPMFAD